MQQRKRKPKGSKSSAEKNSNNNNHSEVNGNGKLIKMKTNPIQANLFFFAFLDRSSARQSLNTISLPKSVIESAASPAQINSATPPPLTPNSQGQGSPAAPQTPLSTYSQPSPVSKFATGGKFFGSVLNGGFLNQHGPSNLMSPNYSPEPQQNSVYMYPDFVAMSEVAVGDMGGRFSGKRGGVKTEQITNGMVTGHHYHHGMINASRSPSVDEDQVIHHSLPYTPKLEESE